MIIIIIKSFIIGHIDKKVFSLKKKNYNRSESSKAHYYSIINKTTNKNKS